MKMKLKYLKRRLRFNKKRSYFFIFLFLLVCSVGLGYAAISTTLSIDGSAEFKDARWNVYFDNLNVTTGSVTATTPASITNTTTVSFGAKLDNPGDFYEFTVDVVNGGNMNAMIDSFNILPELTAAQQNYLSYKVTYSDGIALAKYQKLDVGATETLKVRFEYLENADATLYPTEDDNLTIAFDVTYVQADSNAIAIVHPFTGTIYTVNKYNSSVTGHNAVWLNQAFPTGITKYSDAEDALDVWTTLTGIRYPFYLKHTVEDGIVTESYVEFIVTDEMVDSIPQMVAGTYTLRGDKTYDSTTTSWLVDESYISPYYEANKEALKTAFGYDNSSVCYESGEGRSSIYDCSVEGLGVIVCADGYVESNSDGVAGCYTVNDGSANCSW